MNYQIWFKKNNKWILHKEFSGPWENAMAVVRVKYWERGVAAELFVEGAGPIAIQTPTLGP